MLHGQFLTEMLRRIGAHKAKVFAVLDLTQGYHQAPLTLAARVYAAFILFCGVYQFTRLPFGPKRAPSYFHCISWIDLRYMRNVYR
jgi:hypothetical protein